MGKSIWDLIVELDNQKHKWLYNAKENSHYVQLPFVNIESQIFVGQYFGITGKAEMSFNKLGFQVPYFPKVKHTASVFIIGTIIFHNTILKDKYFAGLTHSKRNLFAFLWYLTSLFHDIATDFEKNHNKENDISTIKKLKKFFSITEYPHGNANESQINYLFNYIDKYYRYKLEKFKKIDHGICGGLLLYDRLIKNRREKEKQAKENGIGSRFWHRSLEGHYNEICIAIATHNIWYKNQEVVKSIPEFKTLKKLNCDDSPLLFLLGLVDTIDPLKIFNCKKNEEKIFKELELAFPNKQTIVLKIKKESDIDPVRFKKLKEDLNWLNVDSKLIDRGIIIKIL